MEFQLGDRIDNKATFVGYFDSVNPDDSSTQRYAYFVVDSTYRVKSKMWGMSVPTDYPAYTTASDAEAAKESATWNTQEMIDTGSANYQAANSCRSVSITYNGNTYYGQLPNLYELEQIYANRVALDAADPTTDTDNNLTNWTIGGGQGDVWSSNNSSSGGYKVNASGQAAVLTRTQTRNVIPVIEIPIDNSSISYNNLGFTATCTGGYKVYIDEVLYGTYNSGAQCSITWSEYTATAGESITTPSALTAHKIWVEPATIGNNITAFRCQRVAAIGTEEQGLLWGHFNLINAITIRATFGGETTIRNFLLKAITAKNNLITYTVSSNNSQSGFYSSFASCSSLEYLPVLKAENTNYPSGVYISFRGVPAKKVVIKNNNGGEAFDMLFNAKVEEFSVENGLTFATGTANHSANGATNLKKLPKINNNKGEIFIMNNCTSLEPTNIDDRFNDIRTVFRLYGTNASNFIALKSLRVSNEAPFDYATAPQIQVDYTDLDRQALVQLFNDLPTVSAGQIISIVGATGAGDLTQDDKDIALNKGWSLTLS